MSQDTPLVFGTADVPVFDRDAQPWRKYSDGRRPGLSRQKLWQWAGETHRTLPDAIPRSAANKKDAWSLCQITAMAQLLLPLTPAARSHRHALHLIETGPG
jgi:hypothetical protein